MFSRFGDSTRDSCNFIRGSQSGIASDKKPFFTGKNVDERMSKIRPSIREIRQSWDDFDNHVSNLEKLFFKENEDKYKGRELFRERLSKFRDWIDRDSKKINKSQNLEYGAIKFYTSRNGYELIFRTMNKMFRDESEFTENNFKSLVFLVELLNIDLYNYNELNPGVSDFKDMNRVYRGLNMSQKEFEFMEEFMEEQDVKRRYISTPLGFLSASFDKGVAHSFLETVEDERCPVILETNIISLSSERLEIYKNKYPSSIVSPICATKIDALSDFPEEREVLLRGPFFQVLDIRIEGKFNVVELLMLDSNRDHPTTAELSEEQDQSARKLFKTLVSIERAEYCQKFYLDRGKQEDKIRYQNELDNSKKELEELLQ